MQRYLDVTVLKALAASGAVGLMCGCSGRFAPGQIQPNRTPIGNLRGMVRVQGPVQAPMSDGHVYVYAAGTGGYGTGATSLIRAADNTFEDGDGNYYVVTDELGNFALGGDSTCTTGTQVYMVAVSGDREMTGTANAKMVGLGQCPASGNLAARTPYVVMNDLTTAAFTDAMNGFRSTAFNISSNATNSTAPGNIVNLQWSEAPVAAHGDSNSVNPQAKIGAPADVLRACEKQSDSNKSDNNNDQQQLRTETLPTAEFFKLRKKAPTQCGK